MPAACRHPPQSEAPFAAARPVAERLPQESQRTPLRRHLPSVSTPAGSRPLRYGVTRLHTRSVLAVPPGLDGFLHRWVRGLVASRSRPWGSPGCRTSRPRARGPIGAFPPVPALQSFSLPRSGTHVTVSRCPPAVRRTRVRFDSEALFRSGIRRDDDPWPGPIARCSPGLPYSEPPSTARLALAPKGGGGGAPRAHARRAARETFPRSLLAPAPEGVARRARGRFERADVTMRARSSKRGSSAPPPKRRPGRPEAPWLRSRIAIGSRSCGAPLDRPAWIRRAVPKDRRRHRPVAVPIPTSVVDGQPPQRPSAPAPMRSVRSASSVGASASPVLRWNRTDAARGRAIAA